MHLASKSLPRRLLLLLGLAATDAAYAQCNCTWPVGFAGGCDGAVHALLVDKFPHLTSYQPEYVAFREGDVRHSQADISKARHLLGFEPVYAIQQGLEAAMQWYVDNLTERTDIK